jgi:hypothetical protein
MINDDDRCDRMNGVLHVSLTDKRLYNMIELSLRTSPNLSAHVYMSDRVWKDIVCF